MDAVFKEHASRFSKQIFLTMAMSPCDDAFSVDEDFEDAEQALHPSLLPKATPIAMNGRKRKGIDAGVAAAGTPQRGRAWREREILSSSCSHMPGLRRPKKVLLSSIIMC